MLCDGLAPDIYSDYTLGTLSGSDLSDLGSHLEQGCVRCKAELSFARRMWLGVAFAVPDVEPRRTLKTRVVGSVQDSSGVRVRFAWWQPLVALGIVITGVFVGTQIKKAPALTVRMIPADQPLNALVAENQALRERLAHVPVPVTAPSAVPPTIDKRQQPAIVVPQDQGQVVRAEQALVVQKTLLAEAEREKEELSRKYQAVLAQPKPDLESMQRQLAAVQSRAQQLERDVVEYRTLLVRARERVSPLQTASLLSDPNLRLVRLRSTDKNSPIEGHAFVASGSQVLFYGSQLPALPVGRSYQLWLIRGSAPAIVSAGVFRPDAQRSAVVKFENSNFTSNITTLAVTDEPETGSATPTGHKLLIGL